MNPSLSDRPAAAANATPSSPSPVAGTERWSGRMVLMLAHIAGMIDLVALPVWVGAALIGQYRFSPTQAGAMVTAYLAAVVLASLVFAPRFHRHAAHRAAPLGYLIAALAFGLVPSFTDWLPMTVLHALAGFGAGVGLSFIHGTIGRSARPHRLFAFVNLGLGLLAIVFLGLAQSLIPKHGGALLFMMFAGLMALAALATALAFPRLAVVVPTAQQSALDAARRLQPMAPAVWWAISGITAMTICQAMLFSFVERIGAERGFGERIVGVLIALGFINLLPPVLAALLEKRLLPLWVGVAAAAAQASLAMVVAFSSGFAPYAVAASVFVAVQIFAHTFVFGWLSQHDASGRAVALTPAMLMSGAALGPIIGGALTSGFGMASLGVAAVVVDALAIAFYLRAASKAAAEPSPARVAAPVASH